MEKIMKEKVVRHYILILALYSMSHMVTAGTYVTFLQSKGMSLFQVNLINTVYFSCMFICEIPTGAFADIFGRKRSLIVACALRAISELVYGMSHTFWGFISAELIAAAGFTFMSGAFKAWLVDSLKDRGYHEVNSQVFARAKSISLLLGMGSAIVGSYIGGYSLALPWFVGAAMAVVTGVYVHKVMQEEYFVRGVFTFKGGWHRMREITRSSIHYGITDKSVRFILVITFIQAFAVQALNMFWQPFFGSRGVPQIHYGLIYFGMMTFLVLGTKIAEIRKVSSKDEKSLIIYSQLVTGLLVLCAVTFTSLPIVIACFLFHEVGRGFWEPMRDSYLHKRIPSHERATIDSFCSISPHIGGAFGLVVSGIIAEQGGIPLSWMISSLILIVGAFVVARNGKH